MNGVLLREYNIIREKVLRKGDGKVQKRSYEFERFVISDGVIPKCRFHILNLLPI